MTKTNNINVVKFFQLYLFIILVFFSFKTYGFYILNKTALMCSIIFYTFYWMYSIFVFSWKKHQLNINTSVIYRFWRRALVLFWSIESFTFLVFVYCLLNAPNEIYYVLDNSGLWGNKDLVSKEWLKLFQLVMVSIFLAVFILLTITNYHLVLFWLLLSHIVLLMLIKEEYTDLLVLYNVFFEKQMVMNVVFKLNQIAETPFVNEKNEFTEFGESFNKVFSNVSATYPWETLNLNWEYEMEKNKLRTFSHCLYAIGVLKWAHILFIYVYFLISTYFTVSLKKHSINLFSGHIYNLGFLSVFYLLVFLSIVKLELNLSYSASYAWMWENLNFFFYNFWNISRYIFTFIWEDLYFFISTLNKI